MSEFDDLMRRYEEVRIERDALVEFTDVATEKIEELQQEKDNQAAHIETLEKALAQQQVGTASCEE